MTHPYRLQPDRAFWSRSVANNYEQNELADGFRLLQPEDKLVSAGSCFASNIIQFLKGAGFHYIRTEPSHPIFSKLPPDRFGYDKFSARYGNIYTPRQLLQLLKRATGRFEPKEDRWRIGQYLIDPFRPGLRYPASSDREFDLLKAQHLSATREAFTTATCLIFTLGLTEAWVSSQDGAVFPACPGTIAGVFDSAKHSFVNFTAREVAGDLAELWGELRCLNPALKLILTVSPVPLVATAGNNHVISASMYSKSVLRAAAEEVTLNQPDITYFPAYEIIAGPQAPYEYYEIDRRSVSTIGIEAVMRAFLSRCVCPNGEEGSPPPSTAQSETRLSLGSVVAETECEEMMQDQAVSLFYPQRADQEES